MIRPLYRVILWMHPPAFRRRFAEQMLSIFDEETIESSSFYLVLDGLRSLVLQWLWRTDTWKVFIAICGACFQVLWFVYPRKGHQSWIEDQHTVTPYTQELIFVTLTVVGSLFLATLLLVLWMVSFQRRRSEGRRSGK